MHAQVLLCVNHHTKFKVPSFIISEDMIRANFLKTGHLTLNTPIRVYLYLTLASAISEISLGAPKFKMGHNGILSSIYWD